MHCLLGVMRTVHMHITKIAVPNFIVFSFGWSVLARMFLSTGIAVAAFSLAFEFGIFSMDSSLHCAHVQRTTATPVCERRTHTT